MKKNLLFLIFILLFVKTNLQAQHPVYTQLTEKDGLPDVEFYDIIEDKEGFIWLAADKGLYRYDGKEFKQYSHPKKIGLSVFGLSFDDKGRLWCNNIAGQFFYIENDALQLFYTEKKEKKGLLEFILYKNSLWIYNHVFLNKINVITKEKTVFNNKKNYVKSTFLKKDTLFFFNEKSLYYTVDNTTFLKKVELKTTKIIRTNSFSYNNFSFFYQYNSAKDITSILCLKGKNIYNVTVPKELVNNHVIRVFIEGDLIWFCTKKGIYIYTFSDNSFKLQKKYFKDKAITKVIKDKNNNYILSSLENGIFIIPNIHLEKYQLKDVAINISRMKSINDSTALLGSTKGSLVLLNKNSKKLHYLPIENKGKIFSIASKKGNTYIGFRNRIYAFKNNLLSDDKISPMYSIQAKDIAIINEFKIIYTGYGYASVLNFKDNTQKKIEKKRAYTVYYSEKIKKSYIGYLDGLIEYNEGFTIEKPIQLNNNPIFAVAIEETSNGVIWISTFKDGIIGVKDGAIVEKFTTENGLLSNQTSTLKSDGDLLWIVTDKSIQAFNIKTKTFKNLTLKDGITTFNITDIVPTKETIFFSSNKGLFEFDREKVFKKRSLSEFYIKNISVDDIAVSIDDFSNLDSNTKKVQFQFHTNGFLSEDNIIYQYRLLGASKKWESIPENTGTVTFNSLTHGAYTFQLKVKEVNGEELADIKSIAFEIEFPFYKQWWFIIVSIIIGTLVVFGLVQFRIKKIKEKQNIVLDKERMQKQLVASKLKVLKAQMNPHFTFNALNSIQDYIMLNQKTMAGEFLGKFANLIRNYLHFSDVGFISLSDEIHNLNLYLELEKLRFEEQLTYTFQVDEGFSTDSIKIPPMLIQPYIENALKHGLLHKKTDRRLHISITKKSDEMIRCIVEDNGIGREKSNEINKKRERQHTSFALKATEERLDLLNYEKENKIGVTIIDLKENNIAKGTKVVLKIPIIKE